MISTNTSKIPDDAAREIPAEVTDWLARLVLLYGVPFNYLIPDEEMLPRESIRFFFLDPIWIQYLVQGGCSVGNTDYGDTIIDKAMNKSVQSNQAAAGVRDKLREQCEGVDPTGKGENVAWPLTGFLLRSAVVEGWRGLEIMAYKEIKPEEKAVWNARNLNPEQKKKLAEDNLAPVKPLRIEQLSSDVMLGIFNGPVGQLVIRQPQEGLHFGLTPDPVSGSYTKRLRDMNTGEILQDETRDETIDLSQNNLLREQENKGVIDVTALADQIKERLETHGQLRNNTFTSAEFAVQMIEAPGEFTFKPGVRADH